MEPTTFARRRHQLAVTQTALAELLGVHPVTVNKWERGKEPIPRVVALALRGLLCERDHGTTSGS